MFADRKWSKLGVGFDGFGPRSRLYQNGAREGSVGATNKKARAERPENLQSHQTSVLQVNESGFSQRNATGWGIVESRAARRGAAVRVP